jgi:hypothetical protein
MMKPIRFDDDQSPLIGAYYFFRGDQARARSDMKILRDAGVNHLWLFIDDYFRKDGPKPITEFDEFLQSMKECGMKFIPVIGQFISITEHPEVRIKVGDGTFSSDPRYWNMGCFRHPVNLGWAIHEIVQFLRAYREHPLVCRIQGKIPMSFVHEAYYRTDTPEMGGNNMRPNCYCEYCTRSFLQFLTEKYKSPAEYNRTHATPIREWADIQFPLGPEPDTRLWLDWVEHHSLAIPEFLQQLIAAAQQEAPIYSTHECNDFYPGSWQTVLTGNHLWRMADTIDFGHEDMYPLEFDQQYQIYIYGLMKDLMRSAMDFSRPYTSNGQAFTPWVIEAQLPENSMVEQAYTSLIHGVSGLVWWLGKNLELWKQTKESNAILDYWLSRLDELEPETPRVALFYSYTTLALDLHDRHTMDLQLIYTALCQIGIPVDIITETQIAQGILDRQKYQMIILPGVSSLESGMNQALLAYIETGGTVLSDYSGESNPGYAPFVAWKSDSTSMPRFYRTTEVLTPAGLELFVPVETPAVGIPDFNPGTVKRILATFDNGLPAVVRWEYGKGKLIAAGSLLGIDFANYPGHIHLSKMFPFLIRMNRDARTLVKILCRDCGITPAAESDNPNVELGVFDMAAGGCRLCMAVNHLPEPVMARIKIPKATKLLETIGAQVTSQSDGHDLAVEVRLDGLSGAWFTFQ